MQIKIKSIKKTLLISTLLLFFSLGFYVFASVNEATTKNYLLDSDQDGLTDEEEKTYGTDPLKADTDGDGYSDAVELKNGYDPLKKAPGDKIVVKKTAEIANLDENNLTAKLSEGLQPLLSASENEGKQISVDDIDRVLQESLGNDLNSGAAVVVLPEYSVSEEKVIKQAYENLAASEKKEKIKQDTLKYLADVAYVLATNMPEGINSSGEFRSFVESLITHINDVVKIPADYSFYIPIGKRVEAIVEEAKLIQVPENMVQIHTDGVKLLKAYLQLGENAPAGSSDPIAQAVFVKKIQPLNEASVDYLKDAYLKISEYLAANK